MAERHPQTAQTAADLVRRRSEVRVTDPERERCADRIRDAYGAGALSEDEFEERVSKALVARTRGDLNMLTRDLPRNRSRRDAAAAAALRGHAATYAAVNGGLVATWAATGADAFWPAGSIVPWGAALGLHWYSCRNAWRRDRRRRQLR
jgi:hypothetical protein